MNKENPASSLGWMAIGAGIAIVGIVLMVRDVVEKKVKKKIMYIIKGDWLFDPYIS